MNDNNFVGALTLILLCGMGLVRAADNPPLRILINSKLAEPYYFRDSSNPRQLPTRGIMIDIQAEIARKLNRPAQWIQLPRAQLENAILTGKADLQCFISKQWENRPQDYYWSEIILTVKSQLITLSKDDGALDLAKLNKRRIGTIVQYHYPELDKYFGVGKWQRDDADSDWLNLNKLLQGRIDAMEISDWSLQYWRKNKVELKASKFASATLSTEELRCLIAPRDPSLLLTLNDVISELKKSQRINAIISAYTK